MTTTHAKASSTLYFPLVNKALRDVTMNKMLYLMVLPPVIYLIVFHYIPMYGVIMAFQDVSFKKGYFGSDWAGLKHFEWLFNNPAFLSAFFNTLKINLLRIVIGFPAPIILALIINEVRHTYFKRVVQTLSYLPYFISWVGLKGQTTCVKSRSAWWGAVW